MRCQMSLRWVLLEPERRFWSHDQFLKPCLYTFQKNPLSLHHSSARVTLSNLNSFHYAYGRRMNSYFSKTSHGGGGHSVFTLIYNESRVFLWSIEKWIKVASDKAQSHAKCLKILSISSLWKITHHLAFVLILWFIMLPIFYCS